MRQRSWDSKSGALLCDGVEVGQLYSPSLAYHVAQMLQHAEGLREYLTDAGAPELPGGDGGANG